MGKCIKSIFFLLFFIKRVPSELINEDFLKDGDVTVSSYVYWPNATIPFYIVPDHFDREQSNAILTTLALFAFKTCIKFLPVLSPPQPGHHVMLFTNPEGVRRCVLDTDGHSQDETHSIILGYDCLRSPNIEMMVMKALGFPFEHTRANRDLFIDVLLENIDPSAVELYTRHSKLPLELRALPYDYDSVMHFGDRDYSKNGHRTIIVKDYLNKPVKQNRNGLSPIDIRKIELVYGPECRKRDRQEKLELCQGYPGAARRKREVVTEEVNLRVNRDITPPPELAGNLTDSLKVLGVESEVQDVVDLVYKVSSKALRNARVKYCNESKPDLRLADERVPRNKTKPDLLGIIESIADFTQNMVDNALANLTEFCAVSENMELYERARCPYYSSDRGCPQTYKSTKSGRVQYSTQHRPVYFQSTKNEVNPFRNIQYHHDSLRTDNQSGNANKTVHRLKRDVDSTTEALKTTKGRRSEDVTRVILQRSKDNDQRRNEDGGKDETTNQKKKVDKNSKKREVEETNPNVENHNARREDVTGIIYHRSKDDPTERPLSNISSEVQKATTDNSGNTTKGDLRAGTNFPEKNHRIYSSDRKHRRINKLENRQSKSKYDWNISDMSLEEANQEKKELSEKNRMKQLLAEKIKRQQMAVKKKKSRVQRQRPASEEKRKEEVKDSSPPGGSEGDDAPLPPITVRLSKGNKEFYAERKWPDGVVPYVLQDDPNYDMADVRRRLAEVNEILKKKTCARIEEISEHQAKSRRDYLVLDTGADFITGRVGGRQHFGCLELFRGGQHRQHAAMLVMAMLGFYFELARHDRDKHVRVHLRHVRPDKLHHFEKIRADATFPLAYDYSSATHPAWQFWRKVGKTGISSVATYKSKDPEGKVMKSMGQHKRLLSDLDLVKINSVYGTACFEQRAAE